MSSTKISISGKIVLRLLLELFVSSASAIVAGIGTKRWLHSNDPFVFGLIAFFCTEIVLLLFHVINLVQDESEEIRKTIVSGYLFSRDKNLQHRLVVFLDSYGKTKRQNEVLVRSLSDSLDRLVARATEASHGEIRNLPIEQTNIEYMRELFSSSKKRTTIKTTSYGESAEWWSTRQGKEYYEYSKIALQNGAKFYRIFIVKDDDDFATLKPIMSQQDRDGFTIKYVLASDLPDMDFPHNMMIFGGLPRIKQCSIWIEPLGSRQIAHWNLSVTSTKAEELSRHFSRIDGFAHNWIHT